MKTETQLAFEMLHEKLEIGKLKRRIKHKEKKLEALRKEKQLLKTN